MNIFDFLRRKFTQKQEEEPQEEVYVYPYAQPSQPSKNSIPATKETFQKDVEYVKLSTSKDENVCPMCAQFEGKIFLSTDAPKLPLCPDCACAYMYYFKGELPANAKINHTKDFTLPAECTFQFYKHQKAVYEEKNIYKQIEMLENDLEKLSEFMAPYLSAGFEAPCELACRDLLPDLYAKIGKWDKAENTIKSCISANAYYPENGSKELSDFRIYHNIAERALEYIEKNPGCLQRNMYKVMNVEDIDRECLKYFLRYSLQITKEKAGNTNKLYFNLKKM